MKRALTLFLLLFSISTVDAKEECSLQLELFSKKNQLTLNKLNHNFNGLCSSVQELSNSIKIASVPIGTIVMWSGTINYGHPVVGGQVDKTWVICDGRKVGDISAPDLRDKFIIGAGPEAVSGSYGGQKNVTLKIDNMPTHTHDLEINTESAGKHSHHWELSDDFGMRPVQNGPQWAPYILKEHQNEPQKGSIEYSGITDNSGTHRHRISGNTGRSGKGRAFSLMPPYYALTFIMKVGPR